jgi:Tol biopolymer transport system component
METQSKFRLLSFLLLVGLVLVGYFVYSQGYVGTLQKQNLDFGSKFDPQGTLYFSLIPIDGTAKSGIYSFTMGDKDVKRVLVDDALNASPSLTPGGKLVFSRKESGEEYFQIFSMEPNGADLKKITSSQRLYKREPVVSHDGTKIAFVAQVVDEGLNPTLPRAWRLLVTDLQGKEEYVTRGVNPIFSPDNTKLLVLREKGLYIFDLKKNASNTPDDGKFGVLVLPSVGESNLQMMKFSVSSDNSKLLWSDPKSGKVGLYSLTWEPFKLTLLRTFNTYAFWSAFSPDGQYIALEEVDWGVEAKNPRVVIYSLQTEESKEVLDLSAYSTAYLWMSSWK